MTRGTSRHNKDESGRSKEIEGYINETIQWIDLALPYHWGDSVLDLGCDYGYLLGMLETWWDTQLNIGVDLHYEINPFDVEIMREDMASSLLCSRLLKEKNCKKFDLIIMNHSLEHVENPHAVMRNVNSLLGDYGHVFVGLPHCDSPWVSWDSHLSAWNWNFLEHFMELHGFLSFRKREISLRDYESQPLVEIQSLWKRV